MGVWATGVESVCATVDVAVPFVGWVELEVDARVKVLSDFGDLSLERVHAAARDAWDGAPVVLQGALLQAAWDQVGATVEDDMEELARELVDHERDQALSWEEDSAVEEWKLRRAGVE